MSTVIAKNVQVGADGTASNNFTVYQPATPDGTLRIGNGNSGTTSSLVTVTSAGNVGIGTSSPGYRLDAQGTTPAYFGADSLDGTRVGYAAALPTNSVNCFVGWVPDTVGTGGVNGDLALQPRTSAGANIRFFTGSTSATERARIDSSGNVLVTSAAGLGYGTGSGGTVTQATSKTTNVTLNKPTGQITMNNAALAANTAVQFTLNNSLITGNDVLNICFGPTAMTPSAYTLSVQTGTGVANIVLRNHSAGSLSEAVIINFAIIKGAVA